MARRRHPIFARWYPRLAASMDREIADHRRAVLAGLSGRVLEIGCGAGANFAHYPAGVEAVVGIEPEPYMAGLARDRARESSARITVVGGVAEALPFRDGEFDGAVAVLVLCSVDDPDRAIAETARVLKPGGELRVFEHVGSNRPGVRRAQRVADAVLWSHVFGGCHMARDTRAALVAGGFDDSGLRRARVAGIPFPLSMSAHLVGRAVRL